jgi:hypothetical protein
MWIVVDFVPMYYDSGKMYRTETLLKSRCSLTNPLKGRAHALLLTLRQPLYVIKMGGKDVHRRIMNGTPMITGAGGSDMSSWNFGDCCRQARQIQPSFRSTPHSDIDRQSHPKMTLKISFLWNYM